jgi:hypothetical protein
VVEENGSDVVKMAAQGEKAAPGLQRPDLDLVIVTSGHEEWLGLVEIDTTNGAIVLLESVDQRSHAVVPELNGGRVKRHEDPWSLGVESDALGSGRLGLELGQHSRGGLHFGGGGEAGASIMQI